ncbi:glycosyltransferase family 2 protein [Motilimonas eburnea]|uniref:glycosyltransferase family 2 protein n=1 Tax=Motilimonas eburnea TaxID=1737488 RepID=UPI001E4CAEAA|nr:glycosyltransferase family 2 protein [Motilimonas eburnea]MCE2572800.1 glycosyltransferase [Motilimonas eburnea]
MLTVVIPAYNEANCIEQTLSEYEELVGDRLEVIVIPNGCDDNTADIVRNHFSNMRMVELTEGSKIAAINKGIELASHSHIMIQDADVVISKSDVAKILAFIQTTVYLFASPLTRVIEDSNFWVRKYYRFLKVTPAYRAGMVNSGVYLLSPKAIEKLGNLPRVIADDGYVKGVLGPENVTKINDCFSVVKTPKNLWSLIKIKTRSKLGNLELKEKFVSPTTGKNGISSLFKIALKERMLSDFLVYISVTFLTLIRAKTQLNNARSITWERDESTR